MSKKHRKGLLTKFRQLSFRTKVLIAALTAVILALIVLAIVVTLVNKANEDQPFSAETQARLKTAVANVQLENNVNDDAKAAYQSGGATKLDEVYKKAIDAETDKKRKIKLIINESQLLFAYEKTSQAISVAKTADSLSDDKFLMADWLARLYLGQSEFAQAKEYYALAAKWATSADNQTGQTADYYNQQVAQMTQLAGGK